MGEMPRNDVLLRRLLEAGMIRKGHFLLPDGRHSDTGYDKRAAIERTDLVAPVFWRLGEMLSEHAVTHVTGVSPGGMIVASQAAATSECSIHHLSYEHGIVPLNPNADIVGARFALVDDFAYGERQFDAVLRYLRQRGAAVLVLGAGVALPMREADLPIAPLVAVCHLDAKVYAPDRVPAWLADLPVESLDDWRSSGPRSES